MSPARAFVWGIRFGVGGVLLARHLWRRHELSRAWDELHENMKALERNTRAMIGGAT